MLPQHSNCSWISSSAGVSFGYQPSRLKNIKCWPKSQGSILGKGAHKTDDASARHSLTEEQTSCISKSSMVFCVHPTHTHQLLSRILCTKATATVMRSALAIWHNFTTQGRFQHPNVCQFNLAQTTLHHSNQCKPCTFSQFSKSRAHFISMVQAMHTWLSANDTSQVQSHFKLSVQTWTTNQCWLIPFHLSN